MFDKNYYDTRKQEIQKEFQELRNKFANKFIALHEELRGDEVKLEGKFQDIVNQEAKLKAEALKPKEVKEEPKEEAKNK